MKPTNRSKFTTHLILIALSLSLLSLILGQYYFSKQKERTRDIKYNEIHAIASLKATQLEQWYQERLSEASFFSTSNPYPRYCHEILKGDSLKKEVYQAALSKIMSLNRYENIFLTDQAGNLVLKADTSFVQTGPILKQYCDSASKTRKILVRNLYYCPNSQKIYFELIAPIIHQDQVIATLILRSNPNDYLYPTIQDWPLYSYSAEAFILRREPDSVALISQLHDLDNSKLTVKFPNNQLKIASVSAAHFITGKFEGLDYTLTPILSDIQPVKGTEWILITKIDQEEVYHDLYIKTFLMLVIAFLFLFVLIALTAWTYYNRQRNILRELLQKSEELHQSQVEFGATLNSIDNGVITTDIHGHIKHINPAAAKLIGWIEEAAIGQDLDGVFNLIHDETSECIQSPVAQVVKTRETIQLNHQAILLSHFGEEIPIDSSAAPVLGKSGHVLGVVIVFTDKRKERFHQKMLGIELNLIQYAEQHSLKKTMVAMIDEFSNALNSPIGFMHFLDDKQELIKLGAWSTFTSKYFCHVQDNEPHYPLSKAGIWADAIREGKIVIHNDYPAQSDKKGMPEGHATLQREIVVPIIIHGKVKCILGAGNKAQDYNERDSELAQMLADIIWDIFEKKLAREDIRISEEKYRLLTENSIDAILLTIPDGPIISANQAACDMFQMTEKELIANGRDGIVEMDDSKLPAMLAERKAKGKARGELIFKRKDGSKFCAEITSALFSNSTGETMNSMIIRDLTPIKNSEKALITSKENYLGLINGMNETVWVISFTGEIIDTNRTAEHVLGYSKDELRKIGLTGIDSKLKPEMIQGLIDKMYSSEIQIFETEHRTKDGRFIPVEIVSSLITYNGEKAILSIARDITFRKELLEKISKSEETIRLLFDSTAEGIFGIDEQGVCTFINQAAIRLLGYNSEEELLHKNIHQLIHHSHPGGESCHESECMIAQAMEDGKQAFSNNEIFWRKDNSSFPVEFWSHPILSNQATIGTVVTFIDITERKQKDNIQHLLYEIARTSLISSDIESMLKIIQQEVNKLIYSNKLSFYKLNPDSNELISVKNNQPDKDTFADFETFLARQVVKRNLTMVLSKSEMKPLMELEDFAYEGSLPESWLGVPLHKGTSIRGVLTLNQFRPGISFNTSTIQMMEMIANDLYSVIERNEIMEDLRKTKELAEESDRLKSAFLANMSHEIRTPMNGILGFISLLAEPDLDEENKNAYLDIVTKSSRRLLNTINDIIEISKIEAGVNEINQVQTDIREIMEYLYHFFKLQVSEKGLLFSIEQQINPEKSFILIDKLKIEGILTNLIKNAIKFTDKGFVSFGNYLKDNELVFFVKDSGKGISLEKQQIVFQRFRQAETNVTRDYEGSGLGLAISKAYTEVLGGNIWVESQPGIGSTFFVSIPYKQTAAILRETPDLIPEPHLISGTTCILVAEDDDSSFAYLQVILQKENFTIIRAGNGLEAIDIIKSNALISIVLMDIKMPGLDGLEATRRIRQTHPNLPIIAQTAYAMTGDKEKALASGCNAYLTKPIRKADLLESIRTLLHTIH